MMPPAPVRTAFAAFLVVALSAIPANAQSLPPAAIAGPTYADLVDLSDAATLVVRAQIRKVAPLAPERATGVEPGRARVYIEGRTLGLLVGNGLGESIRYLVDVPLDAKGKLPKLKKAEVLLFATAVPGRPGELQLIAPDAQLPWSETTESRVRAILTALLASDAPPRVLGVREAMHVPGNLVGEGETQIFLATQSGDPVSISVLRRPGAQPRWGVSFGEIVDQAAVAPQRETLAWYRLACFLPQTLNPAAVLASSDGMVAPGIDSVRRSAVEDYRHVMVSLGSCPRTRSAALRPDAARLPVRR